MIRLARVALFALQLTLDASFRKKTNAGVVFLHSKSVIRDALRSHATAMKPALAPCGEHANTQIVIKTPLQPQHSLTKSRVSTLSPNPYMNPYTLHPNQQPQKPKTYNPHIIITPQPAPSTPPLNSTTPSLYTPNNTTTSRNPPHHSSNNSPPPPLLHPLHSPIQVESGRCWFSAQQQAQ